MEILAFAAVVQRFLHGFVLRSNPEATRFADTIPPLRILFEFSVSSVVCVNVLLKIVLV